MGPQLSAGGSRARRHPGALLGLVAAIALGGAAVVGGARAGERASSAGGTGGGAPTSGAAEASPGTSTGPATGTAAPPSSVARDARGWTMHPDRATAAGAAEVLTGGGPYPAPSLGAPLLGLEGGAADLDELIARPTLLFYFSATCPHCIDAAPGMTAIAAEFAGALDVIGLASGGNSLDEIRAFVDGTGVTFPVYKDFMRRFASENKARSTPTVWLVEPRDGAFVTKQEFRPWMGGSELLLRIGMAAAAGQDPWSAFGADTYWGPQACGACHIQEFDSWGLTHHSKAYWTLYERKQAEDPACVGCHVTGLGKPGGFTIGDHASALADVGCEACHGPGGPHGPGKAKDASRSACQGCHDAEHSIGFSLDKGLPWIDHFAATGMDEAAFREARTALVEGRAPKPLLAFPAGDNLGVGACTECHEAQVKGWKKGPHRGAMKTLASKGSAGDAQCVDCHAVPRTEPASSVADYFVDDGVGCEACHGPGQQHVAAQGGTDNIVGLGASCPECVIEAICTTCHTPQQDPDWELKAALKQVHGK
jgi:hypothetical protein